MGLDANTYWLTDRQSQCDYDFYYELTVQFTISELNFPIS
jgi:hypothetical protein